MMLKSGGSRELNRLAALVVALTAAACTSGGHGYQDDPVARKLSWFSYIKGDDVRARCEPGMPDQFRFVYNGIYVEQVRTYDIEPSPLPNHMRMTIRVTEKANLAEIALDPANPDFMKPWRPKTAVVDLPAAEVERLKRALMADGFSSRPAPARSISSIEFYWAVSACLDGQFKLNAYVWPSRPFDEAAFPKLLFGWDMTEVAINRPRKADTLDVYGTTEPNSMTNYFSLRFDQT
jgi:hypothetical protein